MDITVSAGDETYIDEARLAATRLTPAQQLDSTFYHDFWQTLAEQGQITPLVPPDDIMWQQDLGRSLHVVFERLGDLKGKRVLELGCGPGDYTVMMARRGAQVTAVDIAFSSLAITRRRASANDVGQRVSTHHMAAETLAFADANFDWVVGFGLLHHANPVALAPELRRVLKPGGKALFREPLGTNPILEFVRTYVPYRAKDNRSPNEHPLDYTDIDRVGMHFNQTWCREMYLFSMISRAIGSEMSYPGLWTLDEFLLRQLPMLRRWCRYVVIEYAT